MMLSVTRWLRNICGTLEKTLICCRVEDRDEVKAREFLCGLYEI